jgi:hypothetical protein
MALACVLALALAIDVPVQLARAQVYQDDLGKPVPNWDAIPYNGKASEAAITPDSNTQIWGTVEPGTTAATPLCRCAFAFA